MTCSSYSDSNCSTEQSQNTSFCPEVDSALKFLLGSFVSIDIIAAASTRSAPILPINHIQILDNIGISLEPLIGFQNSILALILEVVSLDQWKKEAQSVSKLSIVDLAKRSDRIHERLRRELAAIEKVLSGQALYNSADIPIQAPTHPNISKIFILAAMTYLHVVVSGPYPAVPEIANNVAETIAAFKTLKDVSLLRHVVWPLCISGCLALEEHHDFFRDLMSRAGVTPWCTGNCYEAFSIMQECWKARLSSDESCDWASTMKRRGCSVYLG
jgi:hypothetical protein